VKFDGGLKWITANLSFYSLPYLENCRSSDFGFSRVSNISSSKCINIS